MRHSIGQGSVLLVVALALGIPGVLRAHDHDGAPAHDFRAVESDGPAYPVSGLRFQIVSSTPDARALVELPELEVGLGQVADGFVAPRDSVPIAAVRLVVAPYANYHASALSAIALQISDHLEDEGFENVMVYPVEQQIDPETGRDLRGVGQVHFTLLVRAEPKPRWWWFR